MHVVLPWRVWLWVAVAFGAFLVAAQIVAGRDALSAATTAISFTSIAAFLFVSTPIWRVLWHIPWFKEKAPLLDGTWVGTQASNWPIIEKTKNSAKSSKDKFDVDNAATVLPDLGETDVEATVTSTFFSVCMRLRSHVTNYQRSKTLVSEYCAANGHEPARLTYIFESMVPRPKTTDVDRFDGAAILEVKPVDGHLLMEGRMWTNRGWQRGLNTAGLLSLRRKP